jgi:hypothetical protein
MARTIGISALLLVLVVYINAALVTHALFQIVVQTAPLWLAIVLGLRSSQLCKWVALPCFVCWIFLLALYTFFLTHPLEESSGGYSLIGIASMAAAGVFAIVGTVLCIRMITAVRGTVAATVLAGVFVLQVGVFRLSFLPNIAR